MEKRTGFLLSYIKYGDQDAILHCFTLEEGFKSFFIRSVYATKNKKKPYLVPLQEIVFSVSNKNTDTKLKNIQKIELLENHKTYHNIKQNTVIFFITDFLNQTLRNEQKNVEFYREIQLLKESIFEGNYFSHYSFLIRILQFFGFAPLISQEKYFNVEKGIFQSEIHQNYIDENISQLWKKAFEKENSEKFFVEKKYRKHLMDSILLYYKIHFPDFYVPKSLPVITEILE